MIVIKTKFKFIKPLTLALNGEVLLSNGTVYNIVANLGSLEFEMTGSEININFVETQLLTAPGSIREYEARANDDAIIKISMRIWRDLFCLKDGIWINLPNIFVPTSDAIGLKINRFGLMAGGNITATCGSNENLLQCVIVVIYLWLRNLQKG